VLLARVEVDASILDFLVLTRWLTPAEADDPTRCKEAIGEAISRLLRASAARP
jgi:hypothetical protein